MDHCADSQPLLPILGDELCSLPAIWAGQCAAGREPRRAARTGALVVAKPLAICNKYAAHGVSKAATLNSRQPYLG